MISPRHIPVILTVSLIPTAAMAPAAIYTFQSINAPSSISTLAYDVNDSGQIVGYYQDSIGEHGFMLSDGAFSTIDFPSAFYITQVLGTNNTGQVVGSYQPATGTGSKGFINNTSEATPVRDINNLGQTVGPATPVSYPGATMTFAEGLNDNQHIVGGYALNGVQHAFLDINSTYTPIDVPGAVYTIAFGINNTDRIVGNFIDGNSPNHHGFVYDNGVFQTVDFPGSTETEIFGINNLGDIAGMYRDGFGEHGFLAHDPPGDPPAQVPEPSSLILLLTAVFALCSAGRLLVTNFVIKIWRRLPSLVSGFPEPTDPLLWHPWRHFFRGEVWRRKTLPGRWEYHNREESFDEWCNRQW